jgi:hypothetical protein
MEQITFPNTKPLSVNPFLAFTVQVARIKLESMKQREVMNQSRNYLLTFLKRKPSASEARYREDLESCLIEFKTSNEKALTNVNDALDILNEVPRELEPVIPGDPTNIRVIDGNICRLVINRTRDKLSGARDSLRDIDTLISSRTALELRIYLDENYEQRTSAITFVNQNITLFNEAFANLMTGPIDDDFPPGFRQGSASPARPPRQLYPENEYLEEQSKIIVSNFAFQLTIGLALLIVLLKAPVTINRWSTNSDLGNRANTASGDGGGPYV